MLIGPFLPASCEDSKGLDAFWPSVTRSRSVEGFDHHGAAGSRVASWHWRYVSAFDWGLATIAFKALIACSTFSPLPITTRIVCRHLTSWFCRRR